MINIDSLNGTIVISDTFDLTAATGSVSYPPTFDKIGDEYVLTFTDLRNVECMNTFFYDTIGLTKTRYLDTFYRVSKDGNAFSSWFPLNRFIKDFPSFDPLTLEVKWVRSGKLKTGSIKILEYKLEGDLERDVVEDGGSAYIQPGKELIIKAPYIYKVFKLNNYEVLTSGDLSNIDMKWRYSQDNSRTWSKWEVLNEDNISTARISPIRFFQVEFYVHNNGSTPISILDINLLGDFQNVSKDYFKSNLMGIRDNCYTNVVGAGYYDQSGNFVPYPNPGGVQGSVSAGISGNNCQVDDKGSALPALTTENKAGLYNPYQQNEAFNLLNKLSTDAQEIFGHKVIYFATDPDRKGTDYTLHEYQLYNVACQGELKVSVEGNNFPDSQIVMNQFDLNLFSTMEVHITKKMFKEIFGPQRRPAKEDFLYFCNLNRMYSVDHAQQFRNFNNSAVYYKLILKKFTMAANVSVDNQSINDTLKKLTKNSTLDELMGIEKMEDKKSIANKDQHKVLTNDPIRHSYNVEIVKELIENSSTIISKSHYDLSSGDFGTTAVEYKNINPDIAQGDNIGYMMWFSINNYVKDDVYGLFSYYDEDNLVGWKSVLSNDILTVTLNNATYSYYISGEETPVEDPIELEEETWYCYVLNIDQRQREMSQYIYKRDVDEEYRAAALNGTILRLVHSDTIDIVPFDAYLENIKCKLISSDMKVTNIRLFDNIIPVEVHNKLLNQAILGDDSKHLIFADNANTRIFLPRSPLNE